MFRSNGCGAPGTVVSPMIVGALKLYGFAVNGNVFDPLYTSFHGSVRLNGWKVCPGALDAMRLTLSDTVATWVLLIVIPRLVPTTAFGFCFDTNVTKLPRITADMIASPLSKASAY